jgi:hypothetical protein
MENNMSATTKIDAIDEKGTVYALSNPAMAHLLRVGYTKRDDIEQRITELSNTSVPFRFQLECSVEVYNASQAESVIHKMLKPFRVNDSREFFSVDVKFVKDIFNTIENKPSSLTSKTSVPNKTEEYLQPGQIINLIDGQCFADVNNHNSILYRGKLYRFQQFINYLYRHKYDLEALEINGQKLNDIVDDLLY